VGKEKSVTGTNQYHFLFAGRIGADRTDYKFDYTDEEKADNAALLAKLEQVVRDEARPEGEPEGESSAKVKKLLADAKKQFTAKRKAQKREMTYLSEQFVLKQFYMPEKSEKQLAEEKLDRETKAQAKAAEQQNEEGKQEGGDEGKDGEQAQEDDEDDPNVVAEQVWMVARMSDLNENVWGQSNQQSKLPVTQFFVKSKRGERGKYNPAELAKAEARGEDQVYLQFVKYHMYISDETTYMLTFDADQEGQLGKIAPEEFKDQGNYEEWIQSSGECQWMQIDLSGFVGGQYYMIDTQMDKYNARVPKVVLIYPKHSPAVEKQV
jgi:hypothetical protein